MFSVYVVSGAIKDKCRPSISSHTFYKNCEKKLHPFTLRES